MAKVLTMMTMRMNPLKPQSVPCGQQTARGKQLGKLEAPSAGLEEEGEEGAPLSGQSATGF